MTVLEGSFAGLQGVGIPLPVCIHLQDLGLQFEGAQWTAKHSNTGFSISFFWPVHDRFSFGMNLPGKKRKKRRKRARRTSGRATGSIERVEGGKEAGPGPNNVDDKNETPIVAHQSSQECSHKEQTDPVSSVLSKDDSNSNAEDSAALDLLSCESISYEMRQNIPGVTYMKDGCESWTPVVSRNRRRKKLKQQPISSDDSDSELDVRGAREVSYRERDGVPYLYVCRGCTSRNVKWTPIAPSPIAFRTRGRIKNSPNVI